MTVFKRIDELNNHIAALKANKKKIGFVPTMGALHAGHISLVKLSKQSAESTIASVFINPTQFNDPADFEKYPVSSEKDIEMLKQHGCDAVFMPRVAEMYPDGTQTDKPYPLGDIENVLEGEFRPGHFQGVAQVVHRLLSVVNPDQLFLGRKDYQQYLVISKLIMLVNSSTKLIMGETMREPSGLAMSSRNLRLSPGQYEKAAGIFKTLLFIKNTYPHTDFRVLEKQATDMLINEGFQKVDYVSIADAATLQPAQNGKTKQIIALVAAYMGDVRLIDNMELAK